MRLTTNQNYCDTCDFGKAKECFFDGKEKFNCKDKQIYEKLKEYEELEEQGLLVKLPCKVGKIVYCIFEKWTKCTENAQEFNEYHCQGCECLKCDSKEEKYIHKMKAYSLDWIVANRKLFGKTIFLTKEQAEQKIKEMEREDK